MDFLDYKWKYTAWNDIETIIVYMSSASLCFYKTLCFTFDNVSNVIVPTNECSINGAFNAQLLLHKLRVTIQVGVGLSNFVNE